MVINHDKRWVYLGPPKTGSTSLTYLLTDGDDWQKHGPQLKPTFFGVKQCGQHSMSVPPECDRYLIFASIRNPYSRAVSLWWHWNLESVRKNLDRHMTFQQFLEAVLASQDEDRPPQMTGNGFFHFTLSRWFKWVNRIDHYIRKESLEEDLNRLALAEPVIPPWQNTGPDLIEDGQTRERRQSWKTYYSPATAALVRQWAHDDFERFGYSTET